MSNSNPHNYAPKPRDPKTIEIYKKLEEQNMLNLKNELDTKYNFPKNIQEVVLSSQRAIQRNCLSQMLEVQKYGVSEEKLLKSGKLPTAREGLEKEFEKAMNDLNICKQPISMRLITFKGQTNMLASLNLRSTEFCLDDCEDEMFKNKSNTNYNISACLSDCFENIKYNSHALAQMVEYESQNILKSFSDIPKSQI